MTILKSGDVGRLSTQSTATSTDTVLTVDNNNNIVQSTLNTIQEGMDGINTDIVNVFSVSDFPTPIADVITLESKTYVINGTVIIGINRIEMVDDSSIEGFCPTSSFLFGTGTGVGNLITASTGSLCVKNLRLFHLFTGHALRQTGGGTQDVYISNVVSTGEGFLSTDSSRLVTVDTFEVSDTGAVNNAIEFTGAGGTLILRNGQFTGFNNKAIHLQTSTWDRVNIDNVDFPDVGAGKTAIDGLASNANINVGGKGTISGCNFAGAGTFIDANILPGDTRWQFRDNINVVNSTVIGSIFTSDNATETVITGTGVYTKVNATFSVGTPAQRITTAANRITYVGLEPTIVKVRFDLTARIASGITSAFSDFTIFKNGSILNASAQAQRLVELVDLPISFEILDTAIEDDFYEIFVRNNNVTFANFVIKSYNLILTGQD